jgi:hypothetical protein
MYFLVDKRMRNLLLVGEVEDDRSSYHSFFYFDKLFKDICDASSLVTKDVLSQEGCHMTLFIEKFSSL